jgi:hypothetical protein
MDELQIVKYPLSLAEIQGEISRAPMINLHLDEDSINGRYDDDSENGPNGTASSPPVAAMLARSQEPKGKSARQPPLMAATSSPSKGPKRS